MSDPPTRQYYPLTHSRKCIVTFYANSRSLICRKLDGLRENPTLLRSLGEVNGPATRESYSVLAQRKP